MAAACSSVVALLVRGAPWPKQAIVASTSARWRNDLAAWGRLTLKMPQITVPSSRRAAASPVNRTPWRGRYRAMLPGVWPGDGDYHGAVAEAGIVAVG